MMSAPVPDFDRLRELYDQARALREEDRAAFLDALEDPDDQLRTQLEWMLKFETDLPGDDEDAGEGPTVDQDPRDRPRPPGGTYRRSEHIGPYRVLHEIGRGGMGTVYAAVRDDSNVGGRVAVKVISKGRDTESTINRFKLERRVLSGLAHPYIARFLDGGETEDGSAYFVMEYIEGIPINDYCDRNNLSVRERIELFAKVCAAVHYAHTNLIVHRDLKPHNILVNPQGEPKLLDFGIAKILNPHISVSDVATGLDQRLLTPEYASPEQVRGEPLKTQSDVYSLGILLYELLCGRRPYEFKARLEHEILRIVTEHLPERPSTYLGKLRKADGMDTVQRLAQHRGTRPDPLVRQISGELDDIIMHALQKPPSKRYETAGAMGQDLERYIRGETVLARRPANRHIYRLRKFYQRRRLPITVGAVAAVLMITGGVISIDQWLDARRAELEAARASRYAEVVWEKLAESAIDIRLPVEQRRALYADILEEFGQLEREHGGLSDRMRLRRADVLLELADVEFSRRGSSARDPSEARRLIDGATQTLDAMGADTGISATALRVKAARHLADISKTRGNTDEAIAHYRSVIDLVTRASAEYEEDRIQLWAARNANSARRSIAGLYRDQCRLDEATRLLAEARDEADRLRRAYPDNNRVLRDWTVAQSSVVFSELESGNLEAALREVSPLVSTRARLHELDTGSPRTIRDYATALLARSDVLGALGDHDAAIEPLTLAAEKLRTGMEITNGQDMRMRETLAIVLSELGAARVMAGQPDDAADALDELRVATQPMRRQQTPPDDVLEILAGVHHLDAMIAIAAGDASRAQDEQRRIGNTLGQGIDRQALRARGIILAARRAELARDAMPELASVMARDAAAALEGLEAAGRGCLVPERVKGVFR